ncbi:MAG: hypothetical protein RIQ47_526 [Bacteroidota bacterium]|jgi:hypothetical protein
MKKSLLALGIALLSLFSFGPQAFANRNCGTMDHLNQQLQADPTLQQKMQDIENQTSAYVAQQISKNGNRTAAVITIPVVFHVIYNTTAQNISDALCLAQLNQLNLDFAKLNSDASSIPSIFTGVAANTNIQFCMAQRDPSGNPTTGIQRRQTTVTSFSTNNAMKFFANGGLDAWPASSYLNVWVCNMGGGILGYAQFPGGSASTDGVVLLYNSVGSVQTPGSGAPYNLGRTGTHEVGHWLNLRHIWGDASCGDDLVNDTPVHNTSNSGCPAYPHYSTCSGSPVEMTMNYMDYTYDACMYMFTTGQSTRMNALFASGGARASFLNSLGCVPPSGCGTPSNLTATNISGTGVTLNWSAAANATSYNVQYCVTGTTNCVSTTSTGNSITLSGLTGGTSYTYSIQAVCSSGTSTTVTGTFATLATSCGDATNLTVGSITSTTAALSWTAVGGALSYNIQYKTSTATTWTTVTSTTSSRSLTGLSPSTTYNWRVQAVCNGLSGIYLAGTDFTTLAPSCGNATNLTTSSISSTGATLNWTAVSGATSYNIQYKTSTATTWTTVTSTTNSRAITGLTAATTYNWQVQSVCVGASGTYVAGPNFTTSAASCTDAFESNNSRSAAKTVPLNTDVTALISTSSDRDWFKFTTVSPNTNIRITLTNLPFDYDIRLYNSSGSTLATSANGSTLSETIIRNTTAAASYFIQVYPYGSTNFSSTRCYTLRVSVGSTAFRLTDNGLVEENMEELTKESFVLYPNPTQNEVNVLFNASTARNFNLNIFDMVGKQVYSQSLSMEEGQNKYNINLADLSKGIYFVELINNEERQVKKLVIER